VPGWHSARASVTRSRWPPDSAEPPSPTDVRSPARVRACGDALVWRVCASRRAHAHAPPHRVT
jgi:hypothetical protein